MNKSPATILFDLDGTLIDTRRLYLESYRRALEPFLGYPPTDEEMIAKGASSERLFLAGWVKSDELSACHLQMSGHYATLHSTLCDGLYDGVREMLAALRAAGLQLGLVTGKSRPAWEITSRDVPLGDFDIVVTDDDVEAPKPHPGGLLKAAAALRVDPTAVAFIGDSEADIRAGRLAGMRAGAAMWPKRRDGDRQRFLDQIRPFAPDWIFERPADVTRVLAPWC